MEMNRINNFYSVVTGKTESEGVWYIYCQIYLGGQVFCRTIESVDFDKMVSWLDELYLPEYVFHDATIQLFNHAKDILIAKSSNPKTLFKNYIDWCLGFHVDVDEDKN